jgi:hypothetical protein
MLRRSLVPAAVLGLVVVTASIAAVTSPAAAAIAKWPPWISIESPVNPFDASARGAAFLIRATVREGTPTLADVHATAEGLVNGVRKSVPIRIDTTSRAGVFAVRKQWPAEGTWMLRISFMSTTAIVSIDRAGNVGGVTVPTVAQSGVQIPRAVAAREIDALLADASKR